MEILKGLHDQNQDNNKKGAGYRVRRGSNEKDVEFLMNNGYISQRSNYVDWVYFITKKGREAIGVTNELPKDLMTKNIKDVFGIRDKNGITLFKQKNAHYLSPDNPFFQTSTWVEIRFTG